MRKRMIGAGIATAIAVTGIAAGSGLADHTPDTPTNVTVVGTPARAQIAGGPWTLAQGILGSSSTGTPKVGSYPNDYTLPFAQTNAGRTNLMAPYYFPYVTGEGRDLNGLFDYRPRSAMESVVSATSEDGGKTWKYTGQALAYTPQANYQYQQAPNDPTKAGANLFANGSDDGQGHPFAYRFCGHHYLYTLNRTAGIIDSGELLVHELASGDPGHKSPLRHLPANETPAGNSLVAMHTVGLAGADGIIGVVRAGHGTYHVLWVRKNLAPAVNGYNTDTTEVLLSTTTDGIHFTGTTPVNGLNTSTDGTKSFANDTSGSVAPGGSPSTETRWITSRGTLVSFHNDGHASYGLFFSGGLYTDQDSDAFHYIGYATSTDLTHWTLRNGISASRGLNNPLLSTPGFQNQVANAPGSTFYSGRVYDPQVVLAPNGKTATMVFAGYNTGKPKNNQADYRQIGVVTLNLGH
jgi:hypothetical protein